mmetsp:Transcript_43944/g.116164  ORF Transcript_43944/g.116164 Transcript_43944/m.116164 type:complete len:758 (-) Transcript_43944:214-2487(-)
MLPPTPARPEVEVEGRCLKISWVIPATEPEVSACALKVRIVGSQKYQNYDFGTGRLVSKGGSAVPAPTCEVMAECEEGLEYEVIVAAMNAKGWSEVSACSEPACVGAVLPRARPPAPLAPTLTLLHGKLKCSWSIPQACPPVEASQVQVTVAGQRWLVDASGNLVHTGRTTFAAPRCEATINTTSGVAASVCCRNAEGFGSYSPLSLPGTEVIGEVHGGEMVLAERDDTTAPKLVPLTEGKMRVQWDLPAEAKSTAVKLRPFGDKNWYLCGGTAIAAPASETVAQLEDGFEYEAMVSFLVDGQWCNSSVSKACIGELKVPGVPGAGKEPQLFIVDRCRMSVKWKIPTVVPPVTGTLVKFRCLGSRTWHHVTLSGQLVEQEDAVPAPTSEVDVIGLEEGIKYEAAIVLRNRLGKGPESPCSEPLCIGRSAPRLLRCQYCYCDFDLQHAPYTKNPECFWCPPCRFRAMDPFNSVVEPNGLLACRVVDRAVTTLELDLTELRTWRREDNSLWMRMVRVDSENSAQAWPRSLTLDANGHDVFSIAAPDEGHVRRDVPRNITAVLRPGINTLSIRVSDEFVPGWAWAIVRTVPRTVKEMAAEIPLCEEEEARIRVCSLLKETYTSDKEEEISCVISNKLKLRCPLSFERVEIPVRGESCMHLQCFGLGAYLESNMKMRALNNRWTCPVCGNILKPRELRVDGFVERVLETPGHIEEVLIMKDGSFRCLESAKVRERDDEERENAKRQRRQGRLMSVEEDESK